MNNFNHYYVGDMNNNLQPLANYSELQTRFIKYDYTTTVSFNQSVSYNVYYHSQLLNYVNNVFCVSMYVDISTNFNSSSNRKTCYGRFFVPQDETDGNSRWTTLHYTQNVAQRRIFSTTIFNYNNIYTSIYSEVDDGYGLFASQQNIFSNPILSIYCDDDGTLTLTANIKYTILAFA